MKKLILGLLLLSTVVSAQPQNFLSGTNINIDATKGINMCAGTGNITLATSCTGGGTQATHIFNGTTGKFQSTGGMSLPDGTAAAPSLNFTEDPDSGIYRIGANNIGVSLGGVSELNLTATALSPSTTGGSSLGTASLLWNDIYFSGEALGSNGTAALPTFSFSGDPNTGIYRKSENEIGLAANGVGYVAMDTGSLFPITHNLTELGYGSIRWKNSFVQGYSATGVAATVTAAGTTVADATLLATSINIVTTAASGTGVKLPTYTNGVGIEVTVQNLGANNLLLYPNTAAGNINSAADGVGITLAAATDDIAVCKLYNLGSDLWSCARFAGPAS